MKKLANNIGKIISIIAILSALVFDIILLWSNFFPFMYNFLIILISNSLVIVFFKLLSVKRLRTWVKYIVVLFSIIFTFLFSFIDSYLIETVNTLKKIETSKVVTEEYYVIVKTGAYKDLSELKDKNVGTFVESIELYQNALDNFKSKVESILKEYDSVRLMVDDILKGKLDAIFISSAHKDGLEQDYPDLFKSLNVLSKIETEKEIENFEIIGENIDVQNKPMLIYVSGMDAFGNISARGRSDVNMIIALNPNTHEILLTSIPRDYYVQLHGTTGHRDKLTHAGFYGIDNSINTIQNLLDIKFDAYIKINFSLVVNLIDAIGGVDVYSDKSFTPWTNNKVYITRGVNHMDGAKALAFARERMTYRTGDRHRIQNQQDVLKALVEKVSTSEVLLTKYKNILHSLTGTFETNIEMSHITDMIKFQLKELPKWTVKSYNLNGYDHSGYTHTYGNQLLYVMEPDVRTVNQAKIFINGILEGKTFAELGL